MKKGVKPPRNDVRKNITITQEQFIILAQEAKELYDNNLSMHIRNIFDQYIRKKGVFQEMHYN